MSKTKNDDRLSLRLPGTLKMKLKRYALKVYKNCNQVIIDLLETILK